MKTLATAIAMAAFSATSAIAQYNPFFPYYNYPHGLPQGSMFGADPITRFTTSFRTAIVTEAMVDAKAQETAPDALCGGRKRMRNTVRDFPSRMAPRLICD